MRIISGKLGGRTLRAPKGSATRPTSDRVRESLFSILGPPEATTAVLDLFAGAGTLGLEALSRGAARAMFVDDSKACAKVLRDNIATLAVADQCSVIVARLPAALKRLPIRGSEFDWIFVDAPYASEHGPATLEFIGHGDLLRGPNALLVVEHDKRRAPDPEVGSLVRTDQRRYGDTQISFYRRGNP